MNQFLEWLSHLFSSWKFWIVVAPWEVGVRIRLGRVAKTLAPGPHFRVPFLDEITLVNTRLRIAPTPPVTMPGTANGKIRMASASVGYLISDPNAAMLRYSHPEVAVLTMAQAEVASGITGEAIRDKLAQAFGPHGITVEFVRFVENVEIRAYRLLNNQYGIGTGNGSEPSTSNALRY